MRTLRCCAFLLMCAVTLGFAADKPPVPDYRLQKTFVLGGEGAWWDYLTFDTSSQRLFVARADRVLVVDPEAGKIQSEIPGVNGAHGIALASDVGRGFATAGQDNVVVVFDLKTLKPVGKVPTAAGPDAIVYDPFAKRVFSFNGRGRSTTIINPADSSVVATVALDGRPEEPVADGRGRIYVDIEDKSELAVIDSQKAMVVSRWPLAPCEEPAALAIDSEHQRLFVGCRNRKLVVVRIDNGKVMAHFPIGQGVDSAAFDPVTGLVFASNWDGTVTVVHEDTPDQFTLVGNVPTAIGARTMALDPKTHNLYLVTAKYQDAEKDRRALVPGTFQLLVVGSTAPIHQ